MERYPIFDQNASAAAAAPARLPDAELRTEKEPLRFPAEDDQHSLVAMAERDLEAALQLLAERAQYVTGASGAAIALLDAQEMVCRASAGPSAPEVGSQLQMQAGLTAESVRLKKVLQCDDAERDLRVNRESCRVMGILSVMVMPLVQDDTVIGVFELLADRTHAFEARDITALTRLSEMVLTALEHAQAARRAFAEIAAKSEAMAGESAAAEPMADAIAKTGQVAGLEKLAAQPATGSGSAALAKIRKCEACGFPVSEGRTLCVDCEQARHAAKDTAVIAAAGPDFLTPPSAPANDWSWFDRHMYTLGTILMALLTILALWLKFR
jgi:putative methionine-R-sulfoxide reductase with GAF domain